MSESKWDENSSSEYPLHNYSLEYAYLNLERSPEFKSVLFCLYSAVFCIAIVGNALVVSIVCRRRSMRSVTNYFLVNKALADVLVVVFCVPVNVLQIAFTGWQLGAFMCKLTPYLQGVAVCASVNTLAAIALDRYFAICHTLVLKIDTRKSRLILLGIWVTAFAIMVPWLVFYQEVEYSNSKQVLYFCIEEWPRFTIQQAYYMGVIFFCCYTIPLAMIVVCYVLIGIKVWRRGALGERNSSTGVIQRSKVKVIKMLAVVCILFAFSWLPLYGLKFWRMIQPEVDVNSQKIVSDIIFPVAQWLGSSNCCVNPLIYCFFSRKFRKGFKDLLTCCDGKVKYVSGSPEARQTMNTRWTSRSSHCQCRV
ncbi:neuropeptide SIFamide receptor-like isoform X1 [Haliotis rufescens]|uniref:neuropeptide SIFamide receptor-like isoform X1 n=1 Tax=Haliotis rufescens TaxID=6454 RepID=UPI00201F1A0C|nr:neuropeptide SIFamide receptor-like isoform X1 [Haliotis rufescens]